MKKLLLIAALLALAPAASAQSLDATFETGRVFNFLTGEYVFGSAPGLEFCVGGFTFNAAWWSDRTNGYFERDLGAEYSRTLRRLTVVGSLSHIAYADETWDWAGTVKLQLRLFGK